MRINSPQIQLSSNQLILKVKTPSILLLILSFSFATFCMLFPIIIFISILSASEEENPVKLLTLIFLSFPFFFGLFLLRISLWNYSGKEIYTFKNDKIDFIADYGWFKDGKKEILIKNINFTSLPKGYENENKEVLIITSNEEIFESVVKIPTSELKNLILTLNSDF